MNKKLTNDELQTTNHLELKKARVPLKSCLKMAFKNLWKKKFRYLAMFLICGLSLAFLSITIELNGDKLRQNIYTMVENGYNYTEIFKRVPVSKKDIKEDYYNKFSSTELDNDSYNKIKEQIPEMVVHQYTPVSIKYAGQNIENKNYFYTGVIDNLIKYDETNHYNLLCGRLPRSDKKEILITDFLYQAFKHFNLYPNLDSVTDILNQRINLKYEHNYTIVGVIKTNYERWTHFSTIEQVTTEDKENYSYNNDMKIMNSIVLPEKYFIIERSAAIDTLRFSNDPNNPLSGKWSLTSKDTNQSVEFDSKMSITSKNVSISNLPTNYEHSDNIPLCATQTLADDQIIIPYTWINDLFSTEENNLDWIDTDNMRFKPELFYKLLGWFYNNIIGHTVTLTITNDLGKTYQKDYLVVGITNDINPITQIQLSSSELKLINNIASQEKEKIIVELPNKAKDAYKLFNKAFKKGYVLNVWAYKQDIENYVVDPFINLASKAGLFIFAAFTIAIMWTIITIEIVDSAKEIGILRSIGLSGTKVSFIFIFQAAFVCFFSYLLGNFLSWYLIPIYNSGITDELNKITLYMYSYTYRSPIILAVFVIGMTLISTIIPLCKIMFKKIIDVINEREN